MPPPPGSDAPSYARHFVGELFLGTFEPLGLHPEVYWMSEVYAAGDMDRYIRAALDAAETIRTIYREVSHVDKEPGWLPLSVICTNCGRVGTTVATDWKERFLDVLRDYTERTPGSLLEEKPAGLAWHYRMVECELGRRRADELHQRLFGLLDEAPVEILLGHAVIELRVRRINKGLVVAALEHGAGLIAASLLIMIELIISPGGDTAATPPRLPGVSMPSSHPLG